MKNTMYKEIIEFIKSLYPNQIPVPLHAPVFLGNEKEYLLDCLDSTYVSYVGPYVSKFEDITAKYVGAKYAIAVVNGTAALQVALQAAGVGRDNEVITQPLTFVATANAISHCGAMPVFVDVDLDTLGMSPEKLRDWLLNHTKYDKEKKQLINKSTKRAITAIVPVHTFGFPCRIEEIVEIANKYDISVIEDAAESLGSFYKGKHTGTFGLAGIFSYNGNKTITTGGGGMIVTNDKNLARKAKHITTTAKVPHRWEYIHDEIAYNYRLPNLNAAIGVAQMEYLDDTIKNKRETAKLYYEFLRDSEVIFFLESYYSFSNYWLNVAQLKNRIKRDNFLEETNFNGVMTRPVWRLTHKLEIYKNCEHKNLTNAEWLESRIVNLPSSCRISWKMTK